MAHGKSHASLKMCLEAINGGGMGELVNVFIKLTPKGVKMKTWWADLLI